MNLSELHRKLITAARKDTPSDAVPYGFEKRVMARLMTPRVVDDWAGWVRGFWCGAGVCTAVAILFGAWTFLPLGDRSAEQGFSHELEQTIFAAADDGGSAW